MSNSFPTLTTVSELRKHRATLTGKTAVVMTLGALHAGHLSLIDTAKKHADHVIVTIFVNPLQFGEGEDFDQYPRTLEADQKLLTEAGIDLLFAPTSSEMYPHGPTGVTVTPGPLANLWEGATRPGHFAGVLTVVAKLLHLTTPDIAVFGQKDAQQVAIITSMVNDLDWPVQLVISPTLREPDGLAMSSRNRYLSTTDRQNALALSQALAAATRAAEHGETADVVKNAAIATLADYPDVDVDYVALMHPTDLADVQPNYRGPATLAIAAKVGTTRLIDNTPLTIT